jgi:hypothetical protein
MRAGREKEMMRVTMMAEMEGERDQVSHSSSRVADAMVSRCCWFPSSFD